MAIDTAEKRRSIVGIITGYMPVGVTPNLAKDLQWRQEAGWGYPGIVPNGGSVVTNTMIFIPTYRRRARRRT